MLGQSNSSTVSSYIRIKNQDKTVTPLTSQQSITADPGEGYTGLGTVTVLGVTSSIDSNIRAENIVKDVTILGVTGSYEGVNIHNKENVEFTQDDVYPVPQGYTGFGAVTVTAGAVVAADIEAQLHQINSGSSMIL